MENYLKLCIAGAAAFLSTFQLNYKHYADDAGLFDIAFTKNDITIVFLVTTCWLIKLLLDKNNPTVKTPDLLDVFGSWLITYVLTASTYAFVIYKNIEIGAVLFLMALFAIFSTDFLKLLTEKEAKEQFKNSIITIIKALTDKLSKLIS